MFSGDALLQPFLVVTELQLLESCEASNGQCHVGNSVSVLLVRHYCHNIQSINFSDIGMGPKGAALTSALLRSPNVIWKHSLANSSVCAGQHGKNARRV